MTYYYLMNRELILFRARRALLLIGPTVSLIVSPWTNYDPISVVKVLALSTITFFVASLVFTIRQDLFKKISKTLPTLATLFVLCMLSTMAFSGAPLNQQIWGTFGRNTGFVTYISLLLVCLFTALLVNREFLRNLCWSLIYTSVAATFYALIQLMGRDPIKWSEMRPFATFGNINFSSAFFGLAALVCVITALASKIESFKRALLIFLALMQMWIVSTTSSIQGIMIFGAGLTIALGIFLIKLNRRIRLLFWPYLLLSIGGLYLVIQGLLNNGILAKILYQPSVIFRGDYMHAGWEMTLKFPWFGVGLDSYGDWYRNLRGLISTTRDNPDRIANTAHNIFLDISSTGGLPLITIYLGIFILAFVSSLKYLIKSPKLDPTFLAIFCAWIAYQIQALISINQIAVGIWGWLFTGALIGYSNKELLNSDFETNPKLSKSQKKSFVGKALPIRIAFQTFAFTSIGFFIAVIPVNADSKFRAAYQGGQLEKLIEVENLPGITLFHRELAADRLRTSGLNDQAQNSLREILDQYPRSYYAWRVIAFTDVLPEKKAEALVRIRELDPYNPENR